MANLRVNKITGTEVFETTGSVQFDGADDYLTIPDSSDFTFGSGDFTLEAWIYVQSYGNFPSIINKYSTTGPGTQWFWSLDSNSPGQSFYFYVGVNAIQLRNVGNVPLNRWTHCAVTRNGETIRIFQDGILQGSFSVGTSSMNDTSGAVSIGADADGLYDFRGHISNARIIKGQALYTSNFTPPTRELTVIPNTVLLCCQSTTRANEEKTGKTITVNGNAVANELTPGLLTNRVKSGGDSAIAGSVEFDGTGDWLSIPSSSDFDFGSTNDFTIECWIYQQNRDPTYYTSLFQTDGSNLGGLGLVISPGSSGILQIYRGVFIVSSTSSVPTNGWVHIAATRNSGTTRLFINGGLDGSSAISYTPTFNDIRIGLNPSSGVEKFQGFISNLRVIKGTALYTSNFIPPTAELRNVPGTVLLCCQNPSSATQEATGKTITVNGSATARNFAPAVGFDGTVTFDGVTKINTENYFYLPTGNTEDRGRGRGLFGGGYVPGTSQNTIQFINIQSQGNAQDFGDLSSNMGAADGKSPVAASSATRALFASGFSSPGPVNTMEYVTIATTSNSVDFGDLATNRRDLGACSSSTRALFGGGTTTGSTNTTSAMDFVTIASLGNAVSFGTLTQARRAVASCSSPTRGIFGGGYITASPTATFSNRIDFVTIATTGNATTFGDLQELKQNPGSVSSSVRGIFAGGASPTLRNTIDFVTISTLGNAQDFGDLTISRFYVAACSNSIRGVFGGGLTPTHNNTMDFIVINSTGNAQDFGDLLSVVGYGSGGGCSDSHGGLG